MCSFSIVTFHIKNTLSHIIIVKSMSESDLAVYRHFRIKFYTLKIEKSWYIDQDKNTYTARTWTTKYNSNKKIKITNFQILCFVHKYFHSWRILNCIFSNSCVLIIQTHFKNQSDHILSCRKLRVKW